MRGAGYRSVAHYLVETHLAKDESPTPAAAEATAVEVKEQPLAPATPPLQSGDKLC